MNLAMKHRVWEDAEKAVSPNLCLLQDSVLHVPRTLPGFMVPMREFKIAQASHKPRRD